MTITPLRDPDTLRGGTPTRLPVWDEPPPRRERRWLVRRILATREIGVLTLLALVGYIASAYWTRYGLHFWINDALNRTDDALYTTVGRDPHLGAIGFYWPPLPQLLQLPLVPFFRPFGETIMAGPVSTAIEMAACIPVLGRIGRVLDLPRWVTLLFCLGFAVNPDVIYTASNGMAEACFVLSGFVALLGFLTFIRSGTTRDLLTLTFGLSMLIMTRLEGPFVVIALAVVATFSLRSVRRSAWQLATTLLPPFACFGFWLLVQWILLGDPLFFLHQNGGPPPKPGTAFWLPNAQKDPLSVLPWAFGWVVVLGPLLYLLLAQVILRPMSLRTRGSLGILAAISPILAIQIYTLLAHGASFGDPRYFVMCIPCSIVAGMWLASRGRGPLQLSWNLALGLSMFVSGGTASYALTSGRITHIEGECAYFQYGVAQVLPALGRPQYGKYACVRPSNGLQAWSEADRWIDSHLRPSDRILSDNSADYAASLFSTRPGLFIVRNDRDWQKTVANPVHVTYIISQSATATGFPSVTAGYGEDLGATLLSLDRPGWHLVASFGAAQNVVHQETHVQIWHFVPSVEAGPSPTGTESGIS